MAQRTPALVAGDVLTAADLNTYAMGEGGEWTSWTPTVTQSGTVSRTVTHARYARYGRTIHFEALLSITGSGTVDNDITITLPVTAAIGSNTIAGEAELYDASANVTYHGPLIKSSATVVKIRNTTAGTPRFLGGDLSAFDDALANGDSIIMSGTYEAAS